MSGVGLFFYLLNIPLFLNSSLSSKCMILLHAVRALSLGIFRIDNLSVFSISLSLVLLKNIKAGKGVHLPHASIQDNSVIAVIFPFLHPFYSPPPPPPHIATEACLPRCDARRALEIAVEVPHTEVILF